MLFHSDAPLSTEQELWFKNAIEKRTTGLPVAYITGQKEFFGYTFKVNQSTLIPKPDTEILVEETVKEIEKLSPKTEAKAILVCDMCTGSGCVGLSIVKYCAEEYITLPQFLPNLTMCDISFEALNLARENARILLSPYKAATWRFIQTNLFENVSGTFDIIVSNPPYVPLQETVKLLQDGRSEPALALNGDIENDGSISSSKDGLCLMRRLIPQAYEHLNAGGTLLVESGEYNADKTANIFLNTGFKEVQIINDLEGQKRITRGTKL